MGNQITMDQAFLDLLNKYTDDFEGMKQRKLLRALIYGDPGAGKTTLAYNMVRERGIILHADSAWQVLYKYPELQKKITPVPFEGFSQVRAIAQAHREGIEPWCTYDTLIWDPVSSCVDIVLRNLVELKKKTIDWVKNQPDPEVEGWPHYRIASRKLLDAVVDVNKSDLNVIYVAHVKEPNEKNEQKKIKPSMKLAPDLPAACFKVLHKEVLLLGLAYKEHRNDKRLIS